MKAIVTGGGGFLGGAIVKLLLKRGNEVISLSRHKYPTLEGLGVKQYPADLADAKAIKAASKGCDIVFHVAAKAGISLDYKGYYQVNVEGTENVIEACKTNEIKKLVYTSSPSVTFSGEEQNYVDEKEPYPETYLSPYSETKAIAERLVLKSNSKELATTALRPHLIWGPGDNHLIPRIIDRAKKGKLRSIGDGNNLIDSVYIDNAAEAHILAAERLSPESPISGKAYFISQGEPIPSNDLINMILNAAGLPPLTKSIPPNLAYTLGFILEKLYLLLGLKKEPIMTRFLARQLSTNHFFDITAAKRELAYIPKISIKEGMDILKMELGNNTGQ